MSKLSEFHKWRSLVKSKLENRGYVVSFFDSPKSANNSMRLDFKSNRIEATIVAWEHGSIDFDAYDSAKDEFILLIRWMMRNTQFREYAIHILRLSLEKNKVSRMNAQTLRV